MPTINGTPNADSLDGSATADVINGLGGNDTLAGGDGADVISGGDGNDYINHNVYSNYLLDDGDIDTLRGDAGNDIIDMGRNDIADGGAGRDRGTVYGNGTATTGVTYNLAGFGLAQAETWIESQFGVTLSNFEVFGLVGTAFDDVITGYDGADAGRTVFDSNQNITIEGLAGNDRLTGGAGIDELYGGDGDDILMGGAGADYLDGGAGDDIMDGGSNPINEGNYAIISLGDTGQSVTIDLAISTAQNTGQGMDIFRNITNFIGAGSATSSFTVYGTTNYINYLRGGMGNDTLDGRSGNDLLDGLGGADHLIGGDGIDEAIYRGSTAAVTVNLTTNTATGGWAQGDTFTSIENIAGSAFGDTITGSSVANVLVGNAGNDTLFGMAGNDALWGGAGADVIRGGDGNDEIGGAAGENNVKEWSADGVADTLYGEGGNDNIILSEGDIGDGGDGFDQAFVGFYGRTSALNLDLSAGVEVTLEQMGYVTLSNFELVHVFGTRFNDVISGSAAAEQLTGADGNDTLRGMAGNDWLRGEIGNDIMDGGTGNDQMTGGLGDDRYYLDSVGDAVIEYAGEGTDTIYTTVTLPVLAGNIENLVLLGTANLNGNGSALDNTIIGNSGANILYGYGGNDILDGGAGADRMEGGIGNDTYKVRDAGDVVIELAGQGYDTVQTVISFNAAGQDIERIEVLGSNAANVVGNDLDNVIIGNAGNNYLNAGKGADRMEGGLGNDTYGVENVGDVVVEAANGGTDYVRATISYTLGANVENLALIGSGQINGIGNALNNTIVGNARPNVIIGMGGRDLMTGGGGADRFDFRAVSDSAWNAYDRITDLEDHDVINLSAIDANTNVAGDQGFTLVSAFSGAAGQLMLTYVASSNFTVLAADVNGDGVGDFRVILDGNHADYDNFRL